MGLWDIGAKWLENFVVNRKDAREMATLQQDKAALQAENEILKAKNTALEAKHTILPLEAKPIVNQKKEPAKPFEIHTVINSLSSHKSSSLVEALKDVLPKKRS